MGGGVGNFRAAGIFFSSPNSLYECFLGHSMNIFRVNWRPWIFFRLIFPCANIFFLYFAPAPPPPISLLMVRPLWVVFGLSTLNFKKWVNQGSCKQSKNGVSNKFKQFFWFSFISGTFENNRKASRTASSKEHECGTVILFQANMPEQRVINFNWWPVGTQRSCSGRGKGHRQWTGNR